MSSYWRMSFKASNGKAKGCESSDARGFDEDLEHVSSGLKAVALLRVMEERARPEPAVWSARFETEEDGRRELDRVRERIDRLWAAVGLSVRSDKMRLEKVGQNDF